MHFSPTTAVIRPRLKRKPVLGLLLGCLLNLTLAAGPVAAAEGEETVNYLDLAALMLRDGNLERAITALDQVDLQAEDLDRLRYYTLRGLAHLRLEQPEPAAQALEQAVAIGGAEGVVHVYLAQAYFALERYADVISALDRAGPELQRVASIYHLRAQCHWLLEQPAMALAVLDQAAQVFPEDHSFLRRKVFFLMDLGLYGEAVSQGETFLEQSDGKLEDYVAMGNAMRASGQLDAAARLLELARLRYPAETSVNKVLAHTYLDRGALNTAADLIFEAALLDSALTSEAVELYRRAGRFERALMLNGQVSDQSVKLKQRLALLLELQHFEQVAAMQRDLLRLGLLDDEDIRYALAYANFKVGDFAASETHLQVLTRPDLFRKAAELRRIMQDCTQDRWQCL